MQAKSFITGWELSDAPAIEGILGSWSVTEIWRAARNRSAEIVALIALGGTVGGTLNTDEPFVGLVIGGVVVGLASLLAVTVGRYFHTRR